MSVLKIQLEDGFAHRPGDRLRGVATWEFPQAPRNLEIRLCWVIGGAGVAEARCVESGRIEAPPPQGSHCFEFVLPDGPCSYHGSLTFLHWAAEIIAWPGRQCARVSFTLGPDGKAVGLFPSAEEDE